MQKFSLHALVVVLIGLAAFDYLKTGAGEGREFPTRPVRVIVPFNPGGGTDTYARILQKAIKDYDLMPQPLVIVNKAGGGATIGSTYVKDARNDGYTILCLHEALLTSKVVGQSPHGPEAFAAVAATGESGLAVVVSQDSRFHSLTALLEEARAQPETLKFGVNLGTPTHFAGIQLEEALPGARFRLVSTGGGANRLSALMGGHLDAALFSVGELVRFEENGLKALAYLGEERIESIPEVPTAKELGFPVFSSNLQYWWYPKGTDPKIVDYMAGVLEKAMETEYVRTRSAELEIEPRAIVGRELEERIKRKMDSFSRMVVPVRIELPNVTMWVILGAALFGATAWFKSWIFSQKVEAKRKESGLRFDLAFGVVAMCCLYVILMGLDVLSFVWATGLFVIASGLYLTGGDRTKTFYVVEVALGMSFGLHFVFTKLFAIQLP